MFIHNQQLLLATSNGIIIQQLNLRTQSPVNPLLNFNSFKVNGSIYNLNNATQFKHNQNNIEINYSILYFKTKEEVPLFYRINDGDWIQTQPESRNLNLASLSPGGYKIDFRLNSFQENAFPLKSITFTIQKPWWQKWWFYLVLIIVFLLVVFTIYIWRTNDLIKKNKLATEKMELENALNRSVLTAIKSQMNPHFFHNALNTIQSFIYSNDKKNASTFLNKFSKLTRMILEMSEKDKVTLSEEIASILLYLEIERVRFNDDFEFKIEIQNHIDQEMIKIPSMILQPYIENAIKHGLLHKSGLKKLQIEFKQEERYLVITINDNGIGRKRSLELNKIKRDKHQSFSTDANETRLNLLNRGNHRKVLVEFTDKTDNYNNSEGTLVTISIPLN
jgi:two-component sensor histidine kinase